MKRPIKGFALLCVMLALVLSGCGGNPDEGKDVVVTALKESVEIRGREVAGYDYTSLFSITEGGSPVEVEPSYIDDSAVSDTPGHYEVTCTYKGVSDSVNVSVVLSIYSLTLSVKEVKVKLSQVATYDFIALFAATADGEPAEITSAMVETDVEAALGDYTYTVNFGGKSETLTVHVVPDHTAEIYLSYALLELPVNELSSFRVADLFSLYVDEEAVEIGEELLDKTEITGGVGDECAVTCTYRDDANGLFVQKTAHVKIVAAAETRVEVHNIETYPNGADIDFTTLFTITKGDETVPVTPDMISGTVDYTKAGENVITLTYEGETYEAKVTVLLGVVIRHASSDAVVVRTGTEVRTYPFAQDFIVIINGMRYRDLPDSCFTFHKAGEEDEKPLSELSFAEEGTYAVTLTVPYNTKQLAAGIPPVFVNATSTVEYIVRSSIYTLNVKENYVEIPYGTQEYDPLKNVELTIDGVRQSLVNNPDWESRVEKYAEVLEAPDLTKFGEQTVRLAVYVFGVGSDPEEVSFTVRVRSEIDVVAKDLIVFEGATLYTRDLFTLTANGEPAEVTYDMLSGKVNTFVPGVYTVTFDYEGAWAQSRVVVYAGEMVGRYKTLLRTIPVQEEEDDDEGGGEGWGGGWGDDSDYEEYALTAVKREATTRAASDTTRLGDLVIEQNGNITFNGITAYAAEGIDENTMVVRTNAAYSTPYTLHYEDGIVVLDVTNTQRMTFSDYCRPLVYFSEDIWEADDMYVVNSSDTHVLENTLSASSSLNAIHLKRKSNAEEKWYGLYIRLVLKTSADTVYEVKWGEVVFAGDVPHTVGTKSSLTFCGEVVPFEVQAYSTAKIVKAETAPYGGMRFTGTVDGKEAILLCGTGGQYSLSVGSDTVFSLFSNDVSNMKNGGALADNVLFLYDHEEEVFSYKFKLNTEALTFELEERDIYYGKYGRGDVYLFFDGYGMGEICVRTETRTTSHDPFTYTVSGGVATVEFISSDPKFAYGERAEFYTSPLLNLLTVKSSVAALAGDPFENEAIVDGAIVSVGSTLLASNSRDSFLGGITVKTKDAVYSGADCTNKSKRPYVDVSAVSFSVSGFYQFTVTVKVGGEDVVSYYSVQVLGEKYAGDPLVGMYTGGLFSGSTSVMFDASGRATITYGETVYMGLVSVYGSDFAVKAYSPSGEFLGAKGSLLAKGLISIRFNGALNSGDYVSTVAPKKAIGKAGALYRYDCTDGKTVYIYAKNVSSMGDIVEATEEGGTCTFTLNGEEMRLSVLWGDTENGLTALAAETSADAKSRRKAYPSFH